MKNKVAVLVGVVMFGAAWLVASQKFGGFSTSSLRGELSTAQRPQYAPSPASYPYGIKGLWTDSWGNPYHKNGIKDLWTDPWGNPYHKNRPFNRDEIANNGVGMIAVNAVWGRWQSSRRFSLPCDTGYGRYEYGRNCFIPNEVFDNEVQFYSDKNVEVTAVVYGTISYDIVSNCPFRNTAREMFCAPQERALRDPDFPESPLTFSEFTGMLARRYNGMNGHGKITNFVIGNEVNRSEWYNVGCGGGKACDIAKWIASYANFFKAGYDAITAANPQAKVFVSLDDAFTSTKWDRASGNDGRGEPSISTQTFLTQFASLVGDRKWRLAYHPYNINMADPAFDPQDTASSGKITMGSIGLLSGWLRKNFASRPEVYDDIKITEVGFNSAFPGSEHTQAEALCNSFRNVLGTPGITGYIYHRMMDHKDEAESFGLRTGTGATKSSWGTWALMNRPGIKLDCGFELFPFTLLTRSYSTTSGHHWTSSRLAPAGYRTEFQWKLLRTPSLGTTALYECGVANHTFLSSDFGCEGQEPRGIVGYAYTKNAQGLRPIIRCYLRAADDHFISFDPACEGPSEVEGVLGYAYPPTDTAP